MHEWEIIMKASNYLNELREWMTTYLSIVKETNIAYVHEKVMWHKNKTWLFYMT